MTLSITTKNITANEITGALLDSKTVKIESPVADLNIDFNHGGANFKVDYKPSFKDASSFLKKQLNKIDMLVCAIENESEMDKALAGFQWAVRKDLKDNHNINVTKDGAVADEPIAEPVVKRTVTAAPVSAAEVRPSATPKDGLEKAIYDLAVAGLKSKESQAEMERVIKTKLDAWGIVPGRVDLYIHDNNNEPIKVEGQHKQFEQVFLSIKAGCNVWLVGPAGTGKSTVVEKVAEVTGKDFYAQSVSSQTGAHEFFGFRNAKGEYVPTNFRKAFENGGVFLLDEVDNGNPNVLAALNAALANGVCAFADGMVQKHEDFILVAAGNTYGNGATKKYVGRNKIDAATLDRFVFINFELDEKFEVSLATNKEWCKKVQAFRAKAAEKKLNTIISPRATINGAKLLAQGLPEDMVIQMTIFKGMRQDEISLLGAV